MNENAFKAIRAVLDGMGVTYNVLTHPPSRTSQESAAVRAAAGAPDAVGAKAILCKLTCIETEEFATFVIPGPYRLDNALVKMAVPGLKKFRFATADEMLRICGVLPGCMPPFGPGVFPGVSRLFVDANLLTQELLGFNAAMFEHSIVLAGSEYRKAVSSSATIVTIARREAGTSHV